MSTNRKPRASGRKARGRRPAKSQQRHRLACPFHAKYSDCCQGTGFENNARVVEHLKRAHPADLEVPVANPEAAAASGVSQTSAGCQIERLTHEQLIKIAGLPRDSNMQRKWEAIYKIIFPEDEAVKATFVRSAEQLRDFAQDPPDWLINKLMTINGESRSETMLLMKKFLVFYNVVGGSPSVPPSTADLPTTPPAQSTICDESLDTYIGAMKEMDYSFENTDDVGCSEDLVGLVYSDIGGMPIEFPFELGDPAALDAGHDMMEMKMDAVETFFE